MINLKPIIDYRSNGTIRYFFLTLFGLFEFRCYT